MIKTSISIRGHAYDNCSDLLERGGDDQFRRTVCKELSDVQDVASLKQAFESVVGETRKALLEQMSARGLRTGLRDYDHSFESYNVVIKHKIEGHNLREIKYNFRTSRSFKMSKFRYAGNSPPATQYRLNESSGLGFWADDNGQVTEYNTSSTGNFSNLSIKLGFHDRTDEWKGCNYSGGVSVCEEDVTRAFNMGGRIDSSGFADRLRMIASVSDANERTLRKFDRVVQALGCW